MRVDWKSPASLLEQIIRHEAVHAVRDWEDLRRDFPEDEVWEAPEQVLAAFEDVQKANQDRDRLKNEAQAIMTGRMGEDGIKQFLKEYLEEGKVVVNDEEVAAMKTESSNAVSADDDDVVKRIKELLDNYVRPAVEMDGGAIQFKSYSEGTVNLMMQGSCSGCPSSMITLKAGIEGMMKRMIPEVKEVVAEAE